MNFVAALLHVAGFTLALGSLSTFIVLNVAVGRKQDVELIYHQRLFVSAISWNLTVPGTCVLAFAGIVAALGRQRPFNDPGFVALLTLERQ